MFNNTIQSNDMGLEFVQSLIGMLYGEHGVSGGTLHAVVCMVRRTYSWGLIDTWMTLGRCVRYITKHKGGVSPRPQLHKDDNTTHLQRSILLTRNNGGLHGKQKRELYSTIYNRRRKTALPLNHRDYGCVSYAWEPAETRKRGERYADSEGRLFLLPVGDKESVEDDYILYLSKKPIVTI
eukprot:GHVN01036013.1.p1 GENE.GHVN01036013.1~~GHVN01036013.1.p1  ORF type:complete len:180 (-),score=3.55 GHVN01036013.1:129-668(-)